MRPFCAKKVGRSDALVLPDEEIECVSFGGSCTNGTRASLQMGIQIGPDVLGLAASLAAEAANSVEINDWNDTSQPYLTRCGRSRKVLVDSPSVRPLAAHQMRRLASTRTQALGFARPEKARGVSRD